MRIALWDTDVIRACEATGRLAVTSPGHSCHWFELRVRHPPIVLVGLANLVRASVGDGGRSGAEAA